MGLKDSVDSKYKIVILAAKRAKQLINGAKKKVEFKAENPLTVALKEIEEGKVDFDVLHAEDNKEVELFDETQTEEESLEAKMEMGEEEDDQSEEEEN